MPDKSVVETRLAAGVSDSLYQQYREAFRAEDVVWIGLAMAVLFFLGFAS